MSLAITTSQTSLVGNGVQTAFPTGFSYETASDLTVEVAPSGGAYVPKVLGVDYLAGSGLEEPGGIVLFVIAPANLSTVRITRNTPRTQPIDLESQFEMLPEVVEGGFDREGRLIQELERRVALLEAGGTSVELDASKVTDTFTVDEPPEDTFPRNVACVGAPTGVFIGLIRDNTDGTLVHYGLGLPDISAVALNQFTVRYIPGLTPGHSYTVTYLVITL